MIEVDDDGDANVFDTVRYVNASGVIGDVEVWQTDAVWAAKTVTSLSVNTVYRYRVKSRNADSEESSYGATVSTYTASQTPGAPVVDNVNTTSMRVNVTPAGGEPSITSFLIEVDDDGDANVFDTVRYVNASGVIGDVEVWQTDATWGSQNGDFLCRSTPCIDTASSPATPTAKRVLTVRQFPPTLCHKHPTRQSWTPAKTPACV